MPARRTSGSSSVRLSACSSSVSCVANLSESERRCCRSTPWMRQCRLLPFPPTRLSRRPGRLLVGCPDGESVHALPCHNEAFPTPAQFSSSQAVQEACRNNLPPPRLCRLFHVTMRLSQHLPSLLPTRLSREGCCVPQKDNLTSVDGPEGFCKEVLKIGDMSLAGSDIEDILVLPARSWL